MTSNPPTGQAPATPAGTKRRAQRVALDLFSRNGYDVTSMREIAAELGVTKAALYYHFAGKEDIVRSIVEDFARDVDELAAGTRQSPPPGPEEVLRRWAALARLDGLALMRFLQSNQRIVAELDLEGGGSMRHRMEPLFDALAGPDPSVERRLRARLAMAAVQAAGILSEGLEADPDEVYDIAVAAALELLGRPDLTLPVTGATRR